MGRNDWRSIFQQDKSSQEEPVTFKLKYLIRSLVNEIDDSISKLLVVCGNKERDKSAKQVTYSVYKLHYEESHKSSKPTSSNSLLAPELKLGDRIRRRTSSAWPYSELM